MENVTGSVPTATRRLPRRDLLLLPLLSVMTIVVLLAGSELLARAFFRVSSKETCEVADAKIGFRFRPNCTSRIKSAEGPWVVNQYNDCGYRTREACRPKPAGTARIALLGSSVAQGWHVAYEQTFGARTAAALTARCRRPVEVQNLGRENCSLGCMFHRVDEALALDPDVLVIAVSPYDLETLQPADYRDRYKPIAPPSAAGGVEAAQRRLFLRKAQKALTGSRTVVAVEHYMFQDPTTFLKMWTAYGDKADFLRPPFSAKWEERMKTVDLLLGEIAEKARATGGRVVLGEVPNLAQASIESLQHPPGNLNAGALNERLGAIAQDHGIQFVNVLDTFRRTPGANRMFYVVDAHLNGEGYEMISEPLTEQLITGQSVFRACRRTVAAGTGE